jgi:hypothetical protein
VTPEENSTIVKFLDWANEKENTQLVETWSRWPEDWGPLDNDEIKVLLTKYAKHTEPRGGES